MVDSPRAHLPQTGGHHGSDFSPQQQSHLVPCHGAHQRWNCRGASVPGFPRFPRPPRMGVGASGRAVRRTPTGTRLAPLESTLLPHLQNNAWCGGHVERSRPSSLNMRRYAWGENSIQYSFVPLMTSQIDERMRENCRTLSISSW